MHNHTDCEKSLNSMSVAIGDSCDFTVGQKTAKPHKNERYGTPIKVVMESGDALFFDGGFVPHAVGPINAGTAPQFFKKSDPSFARVSLLFREH